VTLEPVSPQNWATNGHFRSKTSWENHIFSRKNPVKPLGNCQKRNDSDCIFWFFPQFVTHFPHQKWTWRHTFDLKKTTWPQGWEAQMHYMAHGNVVLTFRFWCVAMYQDFLLSFYCHGYYVVKEVINRIHDVDIRENLQWDPRKKVTVMYGWWRGWIDSTTPSKIQRVNRMTVDSYSAFQMPYIQTNFYYYLLTHLGTGKENTQSESTSRAL